MGELDFDVTSFECMPCEKPLLPLFKRWMDLSASKDLASRKLRTDIHLELLHQHPFIKQTGNNKAYDYPAHSFALKRFALNCRSFAKWCKTHKQWKVKAG